jgi:leucyl aminopeptidase
MQITFRQAADAGAARLVARIVEQDKLPDDLERPLAEGARAARFTGKTGQLFEGFVERGGAVVAGRAGRRGTAATAARPRSSAPAPRWRRST